VTVSRNKIVTRSGGEEVVEEIEDEKTGVPPEVRNWGEGLVVGTREERLEPEEALADVELVSLWGMDLGGGCADGWIAGEYAEEWREGWCADGLQIADLDCARGCRTAERKVSSVCCLRGPYSIRLEV
jgi:hypothetical protein